MSDSKQLFRKAALERLSSPEQLDALMQITSPVGWLALLALFIILVVIVLWGIFGRIPDKIQGKGILLRGGEVLGVTSTTTGQVTQILVKSGDTVAKGQEVARISQGDFLRQQALMNQERQSLRAAIEDFERQIRALEETVRKQKALVRKGLLTELKLLNTQNDLAAAKQSRFQKEIRLAQIDSEEEGLKRSSRVVSSYSGRVLEIMVARGNMVHEGTNMLTLEKLSSGLESVIFVPAFHGKKVKVGMSVHISPSTVQAEEYGFMIGKVHSVSELPTTPEGMLGVLQSETLVSELTGNRAHIKMVATLEADETTPSGYKWSSSKGPPLNIYSGTICTAFIMIGEKRPISYVIPLFRKSLAL